MANDFEDLYTRQSFSMLMGFASVTLILAALCCLLSLKLVLGFSTLALGALAAYAGVVRCRWGG